MERIAVEYWPLASFIADEMIAREWKSTDVARRMPGDYQSNIVMINLVLCVQSDQMLITFEDIRSFATAFGISPAFFANLHNGWLQNPDRREPFECPEALLDGLSFPQNDNTRNEGSD